MLTISNEKKVVLILRNEIFLLLLFEFVTRRYACRLCLRLAAFFCSFLIKPS